VRRSAGKAPASRAFAGDEGDIRRLNTNVHRISGVLRKAILSVGVDLLLRRTMLMGNGEDVVTNARLMPPPTFGEAPNSLKRRFKP